MSKGLKFAVYLVQMNLGRSTEELIEVLKPYKKELEAIACVNTSTN